MPHGGFGTRSGKTGKGHKAARKFPKLENNPEFMASVLLAYARAVHRLNKEGRRGPEQYLIYPYPTYCLNHRKCFVKKSLYNIKCENIEQNNFLQRVFFDTYFGK